MRRKAHDHDASHSDTMNQLFHIVSSSVFLAWFLLPTVETLYYAAGAAPEGRPPRPADVEGRAPRSRVTASQALAEGDAIHSQPGARGVRGPSRPPMSISFR